MAGGLVLTQVIPITIDLAVVYEHWSGLCNRLRSTVLWCLTTSQAGGPEVAPKSRGGPADGRQRDSINIGQPVQRPSTGFIVKIVLTPRIKGISRRIGIITLSPVIEEMPLLLASEDTGYPDILLQVDSMGFDPGGSGVRTAHTLLAPRFFLSNVERNMGSGPPLVTDYCFP